MKTNINEGNVILIATSGNDKISKAEVSFCEMHWDFYIFIFYYLGTFESENKRWNYININGWHVSSFIKLKKEKSKFMDFIFIALL